MYKKGEVIGRHRVISILTNKSPYKYSTECIKCGAMSEKWYNGFDLCRLCKPRSRNIIDKGSYIELELTGGEYTKIDKIYYNKLRDNCWYKSIRGSVETRINNKLVKMHRVIMNPIDGLVVDHINGDTLDNRKENLRVCTQYENILNRRGVCGKVKYKGIYKRKGRDSYVARISCKGKIYSKESKNLLELAVWYDDKSKELFGEFAATNKDLGLLS